jgi:hypothetical protein
MTPDFHMMIDRDGISIENEDTETNEDSTPLEDLVEDKILILRPLCQQQARQV